MKDYVTVPLLSLGSAVVLLTVSMALSGTSTVYWNGAPCYAGTQYGFPLPFQYDMNRTAATPPLTHSTAVCSSNANVLPVKTNLSNALDDYLFWFAVSLPIMFAMNRLIAGGEETAEESPELSSAEPNVPLA